MNRGKKGINIATNVFRIKFWSPKHYGKLKNKKPEKFRYEGLVVDEKTKEVIHFHSAAQMLTALEKLQKKAERGRK